MDDSGGEIVEEPAAPCPFDATGPFEKEGDCSFRAEIAVDGGTEVVRMSFLPAASENLPSFGVEDPDSASSVADAALKADQNSATALDVWRPTEYDNCETAIDRTTDSDELVQIAWSQNCDPNQSCVVEEERCSNGSSWGYTFIIVRDDWWAVVGSEACHAEDSVDPEADYIGDEGDGDGGVYVGVYHAGCWVPSPAGPGEPAAPGVAETAVEAQQRVNTVHGVTAAFIAEQVPSLGPVELTGDTWAPA